MLNPYALAEIMAIVKPKENPEFPWEVKYKIEKENLDSYLDASKYINHSGADAVMIEFEFGLFGGNCGDFVLDFVKAIEKPVVITCHTIPEDPSSNYGQVLQKLCQQVSGITVMLNQSVRKLVTGYKIDRKKIFVIPHGTPDLPFTFPDHFKKVKGLKGRFIIGNINLVSEGKGLEYTIEAVAQIVKKIPEILYLVVGQTHPGILMDVGEKYRNSLKDKVKKLGIQKNVKFINKYVSLDELIFWLKTMDVYVTPYLDPQQSSSGALAYAVGAGKACVSTRYNYAKEVLSQGRGILVPFRDSNAIAKAVIDLYTDKEKKISIQRRAYEYGRFMTWPAVALQHLDLFSSAIKKQKNK
jgi:glycosyltransferase involved in cell wall biosynthesis